MQKLKAALWTLGIVVFVLALPFMIFIAVGIAAVAMVYFMVRVCQSEESDPPQQD